MSKEGFDLDKELEKISKNTYKSMKKFEMAFDAKINRLNQEIESLNRKQLKDFDDNKKLTSHYLNIDYSSSTIDRYREKLKKI
ncbi:hypothetical protein [Methanobrevibacter oralis]|uniref:Uncharacterized protein n=1 Tax=Methanobrevibacter oralis TaxID=66851 RepID=A0A165Z2R7_METOA|nr:hypothetical protein [Methanobrevibacter oralis]KZX10178.1 hypothetical protein MBORA_18930 [Methanobrevibacter oralis]